MDVTRLLLDSKLIVKKINNCCISPFVQSQQWLLSLVTIVSSLLAERRQHSQLHHTAMLITHTDSHHPASFCTPSQFSQLIFCCSTTSGHWRKKCLHDYIASFNSVSRNQLSLAKTSLLLNGYTDCSLATCFNIGCETDSKLNSRCKISQTKPSDRRSQKAAACCQWIPHCHH